MFLLIMDAEFKKSLGERFNTSHVSINPSFVKHIDKVNLVSIHLMFLLIKDFRQVRQR